MWACGYSYTCSYSCGMSIQTLPTLHLTTGNDGYLRAAAVVLAGRVSIRFYNTFRRYSFQWLMARNKSICRFFLLLLLVTIAVLWLLSATIILRERKKVKVDYQYDCEVPVGGYRGWNTGIVTELSPKIAIDCSKVMASDEEEIERVSKAVSQWNNSVTDEDMLMKVQNCSWLEDYFSDNLYNSKVEVDFPIAFSFVVHDSPQQILRLLRLLYRPQNSYCIHCDQKSPHQLFFASIAKCFDNVVVPTELEDVVWGHYSVLAAQMSCLTELLDLREKFKHKWNYVINLCGKELPKYTLRQLVVQLERLNGSSSIVAFKSNSTETMNRIKYKTRLKNGSIYLDRHTPLEAPPFPIMAYYKSWTYNALSFPFAHFLATNSTAAKYQDFFKDVKNPEEHFYPTLFMMPGAPGGYREELEEVYFDVAQIIWCYEDFECHGTIVHNVCVVSVRDLPAVVQGTQPFFNKYFMEYDPAIMQCMEELLVKKNKLEYHTDCGSYS